MPKHEADTGAVPRSAAAVAPRIEGLEDVVRRLIAALAEERRSAEAAVERARECEKLLGEFAAGHRDPVALVRRVAELEREKADLRARLQHGRNRVDDILARIRFLENRR